MDGWTNRWTNGLVTNKRDRTFTSGPKRYFLNWRIVQLVKYIFKEEANKKYLKNVNKSTATTPSTITLILFLSQKRLPPIEAILKVKLSCFCLHYIYMCSDYEKQFISNSNSIAISTANRSWFSNCQLCECHIVQKL